MGPGVVLAVLGAILAFAVRANTSVINLTVVGIILMVAGGGLIWHARKGSRRQRIVTREERPGRLDHADPHGASDDRGARPRLSTARTE